MLLGGIDNNNYFEYRVMAGNFLRRISHNLNEICRARNSIIIFSENTQVKLVTNLASQCTISVRLINEEFRGLAFNVIESYGVKRKGEIHRIGVTNMSVLGYKKIADIIVRNTIYKELINHKSLF